MINHIKVVLNQGRQYIPDPTRAEVPGVFRGIPEITGEKVDEEALKSFCPMGAISTAPLTIDLGRCAFCGDCARAFPGKIKFSKNYKMATNNRQQLLIAEGPLREITVEPDLVRETITSLFKRSLRLRQVSAGGDNSNELELNACGNVNFDMSRYGIEFVASPRHADGLVITGPITRNMSKPLQICYDATPSPKLVILAGTEAISGGLFADSEAVDRSFLDAHPPDLLVPGNPVHPLTFINGILDLVRAKTRHST